MPRHAHAHTFLCPSPLPLRPSPPLASSPASLQALTSTHAHEHHPFSSPLAKLDLSVNPALKCDGAIRIAKALQEGMPALRAGAPPAWGCGRILSMNAALGGYDGLKVLCLSNTGIHCRGATALGIALQANGTLQALDLSKNKIAESGARALADGLLANHALLALDMSQNRLGDAGAEAFADALRNAHGLAVLNLEQCNVSARGVAALQSALSASPAAFPPLVSANSVRFAYELALTDPVLQFQMGSKQQRTVDMRRSMLSCEPTRRHVMVGLAHPRVVESRVCNNRGDEIGYVVMTAIIS